MRISGLPDAPRGTVKLLGDGWAACAGSEVGVWYYMRIDDLFCVCKGWEHRRSCYHVDKVREEIVVVRALEEALLKALRKDRLPSDITRSKEFWR